MKLTLFEVKNIYEILLSKKEVIAPIKTNYKIVKILKILQDDYNFYTENAIKIFNKYAERDESSNFIIKDNNFICIKKEDVAAARGELKALDKLTTDLDLPKLNLNELDSFNFCINELIQLNPIIEESDY